MDVAPVKQHVAERLRAACVNQDPFPHLVVDEILPWSVVSDIHRYWPEASQEKTLGQLGRVIGGDYTARKVVPFSIMEKMLDAARLPFWTSMREILYGQEFNGGLLQALQEPLNNRRERIAKEGKKTFGPDSLIVEDSEGYSIKPHTDMPKRLMTVLIYLPEDMSMTQYGTSFYRPKVDMSGKDLRQHHPFELFDRVATVDFIPNRLVAFIRDDNTFHGVETVTAPPHPRRLIIHQLEAMSAPPNRA